MSVNGSVYIDFDEQRFHAVARGEARQSHIRPLLVTLDVPTAISYMDAFTGVTEPVPVSASWDVNLVNNDFRMHLDLHPMLGRYNGVPMRRVDGELGLSVYTRGTNLNCVTTVGPLSALDPKGRTLDGRLVVAVTNDVTRLEFDAKSGLALKDILSIADCLNDGTLDCVSCETPPTITVTGTLMPDPAKQSENDLRGTVAFKRGVFFESPVEDVAFSYAYVGDTISFVYPMETAASAARVHRSAAVANSQLPTPNSQLSVFTPVPLGLYPSNMTMAIQLIAVDGSPIDTCEVAAFIGDECRGATRASDNGLYYLVISGDGAGQSMMLRTCIDGEIIDIDNTQMYVSDANIGTSWEPYVIDLKNVLSGISSIVTDDNNDSDWWTLQGFKIGRRPTQPGVYIHHGEKIIITHMK